MSRLCFSFQEWWSIVHTRQSSLLRQKYEVILSTNCKLNVHANTDVWRSWARELTLPVLKLSFLGCKFIACSSWKNHSPFGYSFTSCYIRLWEQKALVRHGRKKGFCFLLPVLIKYMATCPLCWHIISPCAEALPTFPTPSEHSSWVAS